MDTALQSLKRRTADVHNLNMANAVLGWDHQTYMPAGGAAARAEQTATLERLSHEMFTSAETGRLLERAEREAGGLDPDSDDACYLKRVRRDFDRAVRLPAQLVEELARVTSLAHDQWAQARQASDYAAFSPCLVRILDLVRRKAQAIGYADRIYDALLDEFEPGMTSRQVDGLFGQLKAQLVPLAQRIFQNAPCVDASVLRREYDQTIQKQFAESVLKQCGFDFTRGRQDRAVHPFCTHFSRNDVRITTRYDKRYFPEAFFGSMHEMGHGLYEQNLDPSLEGNLLASGTSLAIHESQSRLWENIVGRSRGFWKYWFPKARAAFPGALGDVDVETFYRAINRVEPSLIRVEADEVTYNLHIILRYEMEQDLLEGRLSVAEAPEAWNAKMQQYLGLKPPDARRGILQDVHWSGGAMGYFPTYTLGNILASQFFAKAIADVPSIPADIEAGRFEALLNWLVRNIHRHGRKYLPADLVRRVTGTDLTIQPYLDYLQAKFLDDSI